VSKTDKTIILKTGAFPGIDRAIIDFNQVSSVLRIVTHVVAPMTKKGIITVIGTRDSLMSGEIIQVGTLGIKYKIVGGVRKLYPYGGFEFRIKRVDGANITLTDINAVVVGGKVKIKSRRPYSKRFDQVVEMLKKED
jgi:hypothetical protein